MPIFPHHFTHSYHDRHQTTHFPFYYGEQQAQGRESSYWTVPGSRTGGALQDYTTWTDPELSAPTSSHFPFILDRHAQQHQDLREYQQHEVRGREWTAAQQAAREYERGFLREGWQRRWEPSNPVRSSREMATKRSESSYRELEAWAARYSHSLPRRRQREAELRGTSHGPLESSRAPERDSRSGTEPQAAGLQQVRKSASIRESGVWDRGGRQQTMTHYPIQAPAPDTSHMLDIKEKAGYQRRLFSQPPGYIAPPPYNSPHKSTPVMQHCDMRCEQEGKRPTYWSQPTLRQQIAAVDLQGKREVEKEYFTKPDGNTSYAELEGSKHRAPGPDALQGGSPIRVQKTHIQQESMLSLQQTQLIQAVQNTKINEQTSSKIIEGRKFRLNKKTGGMTIFCLVSRIADTETPSLPLFTSQANIQSIEFEEVSKGSMDNGDNGHTQKLADEVDFRAPTLTEQANTSDAKKVNAKQKKTPTGSESEMLGDGLSKKTDTGVVSPEKTNLNDANSPFGRQVLQPQSVKYPLWREPSFTSRADTESASTFLKVKSEEVESVGPHNEEECATIHPINVEVRRLDIKKDAQSEDSEGLLVIDTTCVVVKMELIPSPKKDHVHHLGSTRHTEDSPLDIQSSTSSELNSQLNQDVTQNTETNPFQINDSPETEQDFGEKTAPGRGCDISVPCMPSSSISDRETSEGRAERILGIPQHECVTEQHPKDDTSIFDTCVEKWDAEVEPSPMTLCDATEQLSEDTTEKERSQNHLEIGQSEDDVHLQESDDAEDQVQNEDEHLAAPQEQLSNTCEEKDTDLQLDRHNNTSQETKMAEDTVTCEESTTEQSPEENQPENETQHPIQCFSPCKDLSDSSLLSYSVTSLSLASQLATVEGLDPHLAVFDTAEILAPCSETSSLTDTPLQQTFPLPPGLTKSSSSSTLHECNTPSPSPLDLIDQMAEAMPCIEDQHEESETSHVVNNEISDTFEDQGVVSQPQLECEQPDNAACVEDSNITEEQQAQEGDRDPTNLLEQTLEISKENAIDVNIFKQQFQCVPAEDIACIKESHMTEEQVQQKANEDPADLLEMTTSKENMTAGQTQVEVKLLQHQFDNGQEEEALNGKDYMTEEKSQKEASEDTGLSVHSCEIFNKNATDSRTQEEITILQKQFYRGLEENVSCERNNYTTEEPSRTDTDEEQSMTQENATDSQPQVGIEIVQDVEPGTEPSDSTSPSPYHSDCNVSPSPLDELSSPALPSPPHASHESNTEHASLPEMDYVCCLALNPFTTDVGVAETVPPPLQLDSYEESPQLSSPSINESAPNCSPSPSTLPHVGGEGFFFDVPHKEIQYPKSLWDAVNRIRKHTAPDSENEEEEVSEQWDPESIREDLGCPNVILNMNSEILVFNKAGRYEFTTGSVEDVEQHPCHEGPRSHAEEDTLSCGSNSSCSSGDTVIVAEDDEVVETPPEAVTDRKTKSGEDLPTAEKEQSCCSEVNDGTAAEEEGDEQDKGDKIELCLSEDCTAEVVNITAKDMEVSEMEQH